MKQDPFANVYRALTPKELAEMFMNPNAPKTEAEHWAVREIERLRAEIERMRDEDTKTRHALKGWVFVCPDGGDEPTHERVSAVVAEVEKLRAELALEKSGFVLQRGRIEKLRAKIDELMRSHEMIADVMRKESNRADEAWAEVERQRAEIERLRSQVEAVNLLKAEITLLRKALEPLAQLYLWPDDIGEDMANLIRSDDDWSEEANEDADSDVFIKRKYIRAARHALEGKP